MKLITLFAALFIPATTFAAEFQTGEFSCRVAINPETTLRTNVQIEEVSLGNASYPSVSYQAWTQNVDGTISRITRFRGLGSVLQREAGYVSVLVDSTVFLFKDGVLLNPYDVETPCEKVETTPSTVLKQQG